MGNAASTGTIARTYSVGIDALLSEISAQLPLEYDKTYAQYKSHRKAGNL